MKKFRRFVPVVICVLLLIVLAGYAPWKEVGKALAALHPRTYAYLFVLSITYYAIKAVRFWMMLRTLEIYQPPGVSILSYMVAQPVTLLPAGEIYRCKVLERETGVPMRDSLPTFTMQGLLEGAAMTAVGVIGAMAVGELRLPIIGITIAFIFVLLGVQRGYMEHFLAFFNKLPYINIGRARLKKFSRGNQAMLSSRTFPALLVISIVIELLGAAIAYVSVVGLGGQLSLFESILTYVIPLILSFVSFIPGGLGVSEQGTIGIILLAGNPLTTAVAATLVIRVALVGSGLTYGVLAMAFASLRRSKMMSAKRA